MEECVFAAHVREGGTEYKNTNISSVQLCSTGGVGLIYSK